MLKKMYLILVMCFLLIVCLAGCGEKETTLDELEKESLTIDDYKFKLYMDKLYNNGNVVAFDSKIRTEVQRMINEGLNYQKEDVGFADIKYFNIDRSVIEYNGNNENYQIYNQIKEFVSPSLFEINNPNGLTLFGDNYGFYIKTTPMINEKESKRDDYKNFTPNRYFESIVMLFKYELDPVYDSEKKEIVLNEKFYNFGMYVFHTTTEGDLEKFPNSSISYVPTTILYEDISNSALGSVEFDISYEIISGNSSIKQKSNYEFRTMNVNSIVNEIKVNLDSDSDIRINYSINVICSDSYELKQENISEFNHLGKKLLLGGEING